VSLILALDQSTSATKAVLFDDAGALVDKASLEHRQIYPQAGWVEHDAGEIWQNTLGAIRALAARQGDRFQEVAAVSLTNQRETVVVFERATGRPMHHAIVWQDRRGAPLCQRLAAEGWEGAVRSKTGLRLDTYFSASKLQWLLAGRPDLARQLEDGRAVAGTMDAYLIHRLTGGRVFATDFTNASRTLLFDIHQLRWDPELCRLFGVPVHALPEPREPFARYGETDAGGTLPRAVPICGVFGDSQASFFAQRCFQPGTAKATFGTGTSVLFNIGRDCRLSSGGVVTALAWVLQGQRIYALEGLINYSAATLAWLKDQLGLIDDVAQAEPLATAVPDNGGVYLVPAFAGLGAPYWSADARAAIVGLTAFSKREHVVRAALESIAYQVRDVLDLMGVEAGVTLQALHADGGPTRNAFLMQFTADVAGVELRASDVPEASALGAAMAGCLGLGIHPSLERLSALRREVRTFKPQLAPAAVERLRAGWLAAVKRVL